MSESPVVPPAADQEGDVAPRVVSVPRYLAVVALGGAGLIAVMVLWAVAYGISREYGSDSIPWPGILPWALMPAGLITAATAVLRAGTDRQVWSPWVSGGIALVTATVGAGAHTAVAAAAHDSTLDVGATACSPADVAVLTSVSEYSPDLGRPTGQADGSCSILLAARGDATDAVGSVVAAMVADGWQLGPASADGSVTLVHEGAAVVVRAGSTDDKGWTDVVVAIPAG